MPAAPRALWRDAPPRTDPMGAAAAAAAARVGRALLPAALLALALALSPRPAAALPCGADCPAGEGRAERGRGAGRPGAAPPQPPFVSARRYLRGERGLRAGRGLPAVPGRHLLQRGGTARLHHLPEVRRYRAAAGGSSRPPRYCPGVNDGAVAGHGAAREKGTGTATRCACGASRWSHQPRPRASAAPRWTNVIRLVSTFQEYSRI